MSLQEGKWLQAAYLHQGWNDSGSQGIFKQEEEAKTCTSFGDCNTPYPENKTEVPSRCLQNSGDHVKPEEN